MKRSELSRRTPLAPGAPLSRTVPLPRSGLKANAGGHHGPVTKPKRRGAVPARILTVLQARSGGVCEIVLPGCGHTATDPAHRIKQGMGGRHGDAKVAHDVPSNALHVCRWCHTICHQQPALAYRRGWMLREHQNPLTERVFYRGLWRWLTDDGLVLTYLPDGQ